MPFLYPSPTQWTVISPKPIKYQCIATFFATHDAAKHHQTPSLLTAPPSRPRNCSTLWANVFATPRSAPKYIDSHQMRFLHCLVRDHSIPPIFTGGGWGCCTSCCWCCCCYHLTVGLYYYRERIGLWRRDWITHMCSTASDSIGINCSMLWNRLHHFFDVASISSIFTALKKTSAQPLDKFLTSTRAKYLQFCPLIDGFWSLSFPFSTYLQSHHLPSHCHPSWRHVGPNPVANNKWNSTNLVNLCGPNVCVGLCRGFNSCTSSGTSSTTTGFSPSRWPSSACNLSIAYGKANSNGRTTPLCDKARILGFFWTSWKVIPKYWIPSQLTGWWLG